VLRDRIFYETCERAHRNPETDFFFIIDEINRGNTSRIFGELLMLIEADKRSPEYSVALTYAQNREDRFFVPPNLHIIGTMNTADHGVSQLDIALRRRFRFFDIKPAFDNKAFQKHLHDKGVNPDLVKHIVATMNCLNEKISADRKHLGPGFSIGHSYFCEGNSDAKYDEQWLEHIINQEISSLLSEYWHHDPEQVNEEVGKLSA
jgi:5-methylcytosine-specific restriction protein B